MAKSKDPNRDLIKCEYCGELYSVTYKHCPFCNEDGTGRWDELEKLPPEQRAEEEAAAMKRSGGKRMIGGGPYRGGPSIGKIIAIVLSAGLIIAAVLIVISIVRSVLSGGDLPAEPTAAPVESVVPSALPASPAPETSQQPAESQAPAETAAPTATPAPTSTPALGQPTGFRLNRADFTLGYQGETFQLKADFTPAGSGAQVTWESSDPSVVSVTADGLVTAVKPGMVTITATVAGLEQQTCIVRGNFPAGSGQSANAAGLALNRADFTLGYAGETWKLTVSGTSSPVVWAVANAGVATVAGDGTVTAVAPGVTTVTATVDGTSLQCTVRCNW